jgi:hypothetical protein
MTDTVNARRVKGFDEAEESLEQSKNPVWWFTCDSNWEQVVAVTCGGCGMTLTLDGWNIADNGDVTPSIQHSLPACGWHVFLHLDGWEA